MKWLQKQADTRHKPLLKHTLNLLKAVLTSHLHPTLQLCGLPLGGANWRRRNIQEPLPPHCRTANASEEKSSGRSRWYREIDISFVAVKADIDNKFCISERPCCFLKGQSQSVIVLVQICTFTCCEYMHIHHEKYTEGDWMQILTIYNEIGYTLCTAGTIEIITIYGVLECLFL